MKRYIRTKDNKFYDTTKERYLIDGDRLVLAHEYETHPTMTNGNVVFDVYITEKHVDYINCGVIDKESDDILGLINIGDLIHLYIDERDDYQDIKIINADGLYSDKWYITSLLDSKEIYTKQGDDYKLVWDKNRGVI